MHRTRPTTLAHLALSLALLILLAGCTNPAQPRLRAGSLPFPGLLTLYEPFDAENFDSHSYGMPPLFKDGSKGIVYTEYGGFIDVAHLRWTVDWGWYYYQRAQRALAKEKTNLTLPTDKFTRFTVEFDYPDHWHTLSKEQRETLADEIALRLGQELAFLQGHWHEIATFYGYKTTVIISEYESAFAYCDTISHIVGLHVLEDAIREYKKNDFDQAVTVAFFDHLHRLKPYSVDDTYAAIDAVEGRWWTGRRLMRRQLDLGLQGEPIRPWLIPNREGDPGRYGEPLIAPGLHDLDPPAYRDFATIRIKPRIFEAGAIRAAANTDDDAINPYVHFPLIMNDIRQRHYIENGHGTAQP
ncbi:DUF4056 domain-containing protein [Phycisphaerales bacterium AB-hyl4]|uniref:DUF4056 domain-containing protein n=1 Tax=Natronomicrosphaera hydrolytica TaxID=3242702 RepID=A0ABV4TZR8_9BACT